jgi:hypothetical protein
MKTSTKMMTTVAASLLGVALAAGSAYAATGSLSATDAPGQVLKVSGVGPAAAHASETAVTHANAHAKGVLGATATATADATADATASAEADATGGASDADESADVTANSKSAQGIESSTNTAAPLAPSVASQDASTVKGSETGKEISAWAHTKREVEAVPADAPVSVDVDADASVDTSIKAGR